MTLRGRFRIPWLDTILVVEPDIFAPSAVTALLVASVSSHRRGLTILVDPFTNRAAKNARCVWAFDGGAATWPVTLEVGIIRTFMLRSSPYISEN